ncbi:MAG: TIGR02444 family protein, partial [Rhodospirillaceae bacterium]|nr:TIGR02444 family protein [Rhodospirillaceae bacterium]
MATRLNAEDFWTFSLALYCRPPVATACLSLQDRRGVDVNLILAICWLATRGQVAGAEAQAAAIAAVAPWNKAVLKQLREVRRGIDAAFAEVEKTDRQSIKHGLLSVELECERVAQQKILVALEPLVEAGGGTTPRVLAKAGLALYLQGL